jgi:hypothetical protein
MSVNDPQVRKTFYKFTLYTQVTGTFSVDLNLDYDLFQTSNYNESKPQTITISTVTTDTAIYGEPTAVYGTATYGGNPDNVHNTNVIGSGKTVSFRLEDNSTNPTYSLDTAILEYRTNERK